jgi:hypothetical protein
MHVAMTDLPVIVEVGGVSVRGAVDGGMLIHKMNFPAGADFSALLGAQLCPTEHWGTVLEGELRARYADGSEEIIPKGAVYHLRPGHTMRFDTDTTVLEVSPAKETLAVFDRVKAAFDAVLAAQA